MTLFGALCRARPQDPLTQVAAPVMAMMLSSGFAYFLARNCQQRWTLKLRPQRYLQFSADASGYAAECECATSSGASKAAPV